MTVDPNDADLVAAALGGLMDASERRAGLARAGRERVEALFDIRTVARRMDDFIEACVGEGRGRDLKDRPSADRRGQPWRRCCLPVRNG